MGIYHFLSSIGKEISVQTLRQMILDDWDLKREHYDFKWKRFLETLEFVDLETRPLDNGKLQVYIKMRPHPGAPQGFLERLNEVTLSDKAATINEQVVEICKRIDSSEWFTYDKLTCSY